MEPATEDGRVVPAPRLRGRIRVPSDKSIAHRALMANALSGGAAEVVVRAPGEDVFSTANSLSALGVEVTTTTTDETVRFAVRGEPLHGGMLDCGNAGTTMRLLAGTVAGLPVNATLDGDTSLRRRPMTRVATLLSATGAEVQTTGGHAPMRITGRSTLAAVNHRLPVASAQLLGACALAALSADGETRIVSPGDTRDHTERLLAAMGVPIVRDGRVTTIHGPARPRPLSIEVPGDPSSAAYLIVAAAIHPDADLTLVDVGLNPTRLGFVEVLRRMGAAIEVSESPDDRPEPVGEIRVRSAGGRLRAVSLGPDDVPALIDELPLLAVAMAAAEGQSEVRGAGELRIKESDRIETVVRALAAIGAEVEALPDGWRVRRGAPREARIVTEGDHRIAMAFAVAGLAGAAAAVEVDEPVVASVSYPTFWRDLRAIAADEAPVTAG